jgi:glucokinase
MSYYIGVDLGGTNITAGLVDEDYKIVATEKTKTKCPRPSNEILDDMVMLINNLITNNKISLDQIEWVGIGSPGTANRETGVIEYSNNIGFLNVPMAEYISSRVNKKVYIDNDANAAAYGEFMDGAAKEANHAIAITLGTGVGGGIIIDGKIYSGANYAGAELGHMVIEKDGKPCTCGRNGCFEVYSSATGLINMTKESLLENKDSIMWDLIKGNLENTNGRTAFDGMRKNDDAAKAVVDKYISYLATGVLNILNIFQPDILCIGGGISSEGDYLLKPLMEIIKKEVYSRNSVKNTEIVIAQLGNDAGIVGAALLGLNA